MTSLFDSQLFINLFFSWKWQAPFCPRVGLRRLFDLWRKHAVVVVKKISSVWVNERPTNRCHFYVCNTIKKNTENRDEVPTSSSRRDSRRRGGWVNVVGKLEQRRETNEWQLSSRNAHPKPSSLEALRSSSNSLSLFFFFFFPDIDQSRDTCKPLVLWEHDAKLRYKGGHTRCPKVNFRNKRGIVFVEHRKTRQESFTLHYIYLVITKNSSPFFLCYLLVVRSSEECKLRAAENKGSSWVHCLTTCVAICLLQVQRKRNSSWRKRIFETWSTDPQRRKNP
jgi:hypothetical protein